MSQACLKDMRLVFFDCCSEAAGPNGDEQKESAAGTILRMTVGLPISGWKKQKKGLSHHGKVFTEIAPKGGQLSGVFGNRCKAIIFLPFISVLNFGSGQQCIRKIA